MGLLRRKKKSEKVTEDRELVSGNERSIETLTILAEKNEGLIKELRLLKEKLKYLVPSDAAKEYDKKIKNQIEDLRIILVKSEGQDLPKKVDTILTQIKVLIGDRNTNI